MYVVETDIGDYGENRSYDVGTIQSSAQADFDDSYIYAELTDENDVPFAAAGLRSLYPNLVSISYSPRGESEAADYRALWDRQEEKTPSEIFEDLFRQQHGDNEMTPMQLSLLREAIDKVWR